MLKRLAPLTTAEAVGTADCWNCAAVGYRLEARRARTIAAHVNLSSTKTRPPARHAQQQTSIPMPTEDEQLQAFRACPPLPMSDGEMLCPEVVQAAKMLADSLAVCWEWGFFALISLVSALIPQDRFEPAPSIALPSSMWVCLLHPGATNTSAVVGIVSKAAAIMCDRLHRLECEKARQEANGTDADYVQPCRRELLSGGGSLAATGMQMSSQQNRSAALSCELELEQVLRWFTAESGIDTGAPANCGIPLHGIAQSWKNAEPSQS